MHCFLMIFGINTIELHTYIIKDIKIRENN